jgi:hypothetical protein
LNLPTDDGDRSPMTKAVTGHRTPKAHSKSLCYIALTFLLSENGSQ